MLLQRGHHLGHLGRLLADGHVDADQVAPLLGDHRVQADGRLAGEPVADDQLPLTAADGDHGVHGLDAGVHRPAHALPHHHVGSDALHRSRPVSLDRALAVQGLAQRIDHPADEAIAHRHLHDATGGADLVALLDQLVVAEDDSAHRLLFQVQGHPHDVVRELQQLAVHGAAQAVHAGDAVPGLHHRPHVHGSDGAAELLDLLPDYGCYLFRTHGHPVLLATEAGNWRLEVEQATRHPTPNLQLPTPQFHYAPAVSSSCRHPASCARCSL